MGDSLSIVSVCDNCNKSRDKTEERILKTNLAIRQERDFKKKIKIKIICFCIAVLLVWILNNTHTHIYFKNHSQCAINFY